MQCRAFSVHSRSNTMTGGITPIRSVALLLTCRGVSADRSPISGVIRVSSDRASTQAARCLPLPQLWSFCSALSLQIFTLCSLKGTHSESDPLDQFLAQYEVPTTVYVFSSSESALVLLVQSRTQLGKPIRPSLDVAGNHSERIRPNWPARAFQATLCRKDNQPCRPSTQRERGGPPLLATLCCYRRAMQSEPFLPGDDG